MIINVTFDQSTSSLPSGFVACVDAAVSYYEHLFTNNVTVNIRVGFGEVGGHFLFNDPGESASSYSTAISYSQLSSALAALGTPGSSNLPASSPFSGALSITTADEKALGLIAANGSGQDGSIGFSVP